MYYIILQMLQYHIHIFIFVYILFDVFFLGNLIFLYYIITIISNLIKLGFQKNSLKTSDVGIYIIFRFLECLNRKI